MLPFPSGKIIPGREGGGGMEESALLECQEEIQLTPNKLVLTLYRV